MKLICFFFFNFYLPQFYLNDLEYEQKVYPFVYFVVFYPQIFRKCLMWYLMRTSWMMHVSIWQSSWRLIGGRHTRSTWALHPRKVPSEILRVQPCRCPGTILYLPVICHTGLCSICIWTLYSLSWAISTGIVSGADFQLALVLFLANPCITLGYVLSVPSQNIVHLFISQDVVNLTVLKDTVHPAALFLSTYLKILFKILST